MNLKTVIAGTRVRERCHCHGRKTATFRFPKEDEARRALAASSPEVLVNFNMQS
jgi:hypothetical protein